MPGILRVLFYLTIIASVIAPAGAQKQEKPVEIVPSARYKAPSIETSTELQTILNEAVSEALNAYSDRSFKAEDVAVTLIDLRDPNGLRWASINGEKKFYPASVVKMFYMAALERQLEEGKMHHTPELERGLRDMIVDSSNEATQYILDVLTDTSSGAELPQSEFEVWQHKRNRVNRYYTAMGYTNINVNQKTFCEDAYGIEQQSRGYKGQNRNMLTTNATARLLAEIVLGRMNTPERTKRMMELMKRDPFAETKDPDSQATGFIGKALADRNLSGARLWSKAGWVSRERHDAAYIETPEGHKIVLAIFTEKHGSDRNAIPAIAGKIIDRLRKK